MVSDVYRYFVPTARENTLYILRRTYRNEGLKASLYDKPRSGRPRGLTGCDRAKVTLLACSKAPSGHAEWTLRLLADKAVELNLIEKGNGETFKLK